jgi:hypothetical protein
MITDAERTTWENSSPEVNKFVDGIATLFKDNDADPAAYMCIDSVFRAYMHWLWKARELGTPATLARNSTVNVINTMIMEIAGQMTNKGNGDLAQWLGEFMEDLAQELERDIKNLKEGQH